MNEKTEQSNKQLLEIWMETRYKERVPK